MGIRLSALVVACVAAVTLTGCGSGPAAQVSPLDTAVLLASGSGDPRELSEEVSAAQGDVISTDAGGLAEVEFPDGSFMRLGPDSEVTIAELGPAEAQRTSIELDVGQTWHNVQELVADDAVYEVVTPVGVASVRGTVFAITCIEGPSCTFLVLDGEIDVDGIRIAPYQRITLPEQSEPQLAPVATLDDWVTANIDRDATLEDAEPLPDPPAEAASIAGTWNGEFTVTETNSLRQPAGTVASTDWTIGEPVCDPLCAVTVSSSNGWEASASLQDGHLVFSRESPFECTYDDTQEPSGETGVSRFSYDLVIAAAADGMVTSITGTSSGSDELDVGFTTCDVGAGPGVTPVSYESDVVLTRAG